MDKRRSLTESSEHGPLYKRLALDEDGEYGQLHKYLNGLTINDLRNMTIGDLRSTYVGMLSKDSAVVYDRLLDKLIRTLLANWIKRSKVCEERHCSYAHDGRYFKQGVVHTYACLKWVCDRCIRRHHDQFACVECGVVKCR